MASTRTVWLPFPRLITGTVRRCTQPERLATFDVLPVEVPDLEAQEAPIACSTSIMLEEEEETPWAEMREFGGGLFQSIDVRRGDPTPELLADHLSRRMADFESLQPSAVEQELWRLDEVWQGASRGRGVRPEAEHRLVAVHDDGRAAQEALRLQARDNLVIVDGVVHHRVAPPVIAVKFWRDDRVVSDPRGGYTVEPACPLLNFRGHEGTVLPPPWYLFPFHRADEAKAFLADCIGKPQATFAECYALERAAIIDRDAYMRSEANPSPETYTRSCMAAFIEMAAPVVALHDDETVLAFLALRRTLSEGRADREAMLDLARTLRDAPRPAGQRPRDHSEIVREATHLVSRYERFEMDAEPDLDALADLRMG